MCRCGYHPSTEDEYMEHNQSPILWYITKDYCKCSRNFWDRALENQIKLIQDVFNA